MAIVSLHWLFEEWGYEITGSDVYSAYDYAMKAAENLGITDQVKADIITEILEAFKIFDGNYKREQAKASKRKNRR